MDCTCDPPGSCGFHEVPDDAPYPIVRWDQDQLRDAWLGWSELERRLYRKVLAAEKPNETAPLQAARKAAGAVLYQRRRYAWMKLRQRLKTALQKDPNTHSTHKDLLT